MIVDSLSTHARLTTSAASRAGRNAWRGLLRSRLLRWRYRGKPVERLFLMPQDLRTGDPSFASEIYHGHFGLAGTIALLETESPFAVTPPSDAWQRELHGFGWLRHLHASRDEISREHACTLVRDWMDFHGVPGGIAWEPAITARRIISWLSHATLFVEGADEKFYDRVMRSFALQIRYLRASCSDTPDGVPRLTALAALSFAGLCADEANPSPFARTKVLADELKRQILSDGGHISRNPRALIELLLDLLPLRQCYVARDQSPPPELLSAIDKMMPMLRFFRMGAQGFAHFNGMGATPMESLAALMVHDDVQGKPVSHADKSGYCRMEAGGSIVIVDVGRPPPMAYSREAHSGCLSFEMHTGRHPLIVNCGVPANGEAEWRVLARSTAAHSTLVAADTSSSQIVGGSAQGPGGDAARLTGPVNVQAVMKKTDNAVELRASHDGYDQKYGITHVRSLRLSANGKVLSGRDQLIAPHGLKGASRDKNGAYAIRFHLHPAARAELAQDGASVLIALPDREGWKLSVKDGKLSVEESVFLSDVKGPRRAAQVVISGAMGGASEHSVNWSIERISQETKQGAARGESEESSELPLGT